MKWKAPAYGDIRMRRRFLFLPTKVGQHYYWLQYMTYRWRYDYRWYPIGWDDTIHIPGLIERLLKRVM